MKKIFAITALTLFLGALSTPAMAFTEEKPKKAKTESCTEKKACCDKSATTEKACTDKAKTDKPTAAKK